MFTTDFIHENRPKQSETVRNRPKQAEAGRNKKTILCDKASVRLPLHVAFDETVATPSPECDALFEEPSVSQSIFIWYPRRC